LGSCRGAHPPPVHWGRNFKNRREQGEKKVGAPPGGGPWSKQRGKKGLWLGGGKFPHPKNRSHPHPTKQKKKKKKKTKTNKKKKKKKKNDGAP